MVRTLSGWKYEEMVLERLDQLTLDDTRTIAARILEVVHGLVLHMKCEQTNSACLLLAVEFPSFKTTNHRSSVPMMPRVC